MKNETKNLEEASLLRKKAEKRLLEQQNEEPVPLTETDARKLLYELEVHQIELEMQNEELQAAKVKAEIDTEKYTILYDFAPCGYFTLNYSGEILELNLTGASLLGKERSKIINSPFKSYIDLDSVPTFNSFIAQAYETQLSQACEVQTRLWGDQFVVLHLDGIVSANGDHCLLTAINISDRVKAETALQKAKEKAEESDRLKSAFLANMSHEIRTPLNGILGFAALLKENNVTPKEKENYLRIIEKSGLRMLTIINDIINISKIEAGLMTLSKQKVNINETIEYIYNFFKPEVEGRGRQLLYNNSLPENEAILNTDQEKLYAIFINLVKNAIKYSEEGAIEFGYQKKEKFIEFYVKDYGVGILKNRQKAIFERFVQADTMTSKTEEGAGLGLSISASYVEMMGGTIWVESKLKKGSTFYFSLPI